MYIKINTKSAPTCFGLNNHHQGTWHLCFAKVIIIKIVSWNTCGCILYPVLFGACVRACACVRARVCVKCPVQRKNLTLHRALHTHQIGLDIISSHIAEISFNDVFQITILMIITLAEHKCHALWWWLLKPKHVGALLMLILMQILKFFWNI